jgi:IS1 family transposase
LRYGCPENEIGELWTFVGSKPNKKRFIYAYHRESGEIAAYARGSRGLGIAKALKNRLKALGAGGRIASDERGGFLAAFKGSAMTLGKAHAELKETIAACGAGLGEYLGKAVVSPRVSKSIKSLLIWLYFS